MPTRNSLLEEVYDSIIALYKCCSPRRDTILQSLQLSRSQAEVLRFLKHKEKVHVGEIAERLQIGKSAATQLVDSLVERTIIERVHSQTDRRVVEVCLSEKGKDLMKQFRSRYFEEMKIVLSDLSEEELQVLANLKNRLHQPN